MGANSSKDSGAGAPSHTWASSGAQPRPDHDLSKSLQSSVESDASRAQTLELAIQSRVADELRRLAARELVSLHQAQDKISAEATSKTTTTNPSDPTSPPRPPTPEEQAAQEKQQEQELLSLDAQGRPSSRRLVEREVAALREKLLTQHEAREKSKSGMPQSLEEARGEVVRCLRLKDRRPLDCWEEVERFREEVRMVERGWVDGVGGYERR